MTLAQFGAVLSEDEGTVSVLRPGELKGVQDEALPERVGQVLLRPHHVGDSHHSVIHCQRHDIDRNNGNSSVGMLHGTHSSAFAGSVRQHGMKHVPLSSITV